MNPIQIIQGGAITFIVRINDLSTGDPFDLSTVTVLTTCFVKADQTELMLGLGTGITLISGILGKLSVTLSAAQTALLAVVDTATLELSIKLGSADPFKKQIPQAYSVIQSVC